jgi:hypothetical protein
LSDAKYYAQRALTTEAMPLTKYSFELPYVAFFLLPGERLHLKYSRGSIDTIAEVLSVQYDLSTHRIKVVCGNQRGWRDSFGFWLSDVQQYAAQLIDHDSLSPFASASLTLSTLMTFEARLTFSNTSDEHGIASHRSGASNYSWEFFLVGYTYTFTCYRSSDGVPFTINYTAPNGVQPGVEYHVAVAFRHGRMSMFLDGQLVAFADYSEGALKIPAFRLSTGTFFCGTAAGYFFEGNVREVRLWNIARTPEAIALDYASSLSGTETGLVMLLPCNEGAGSTANDLTVNGNNAFMTLGSGWAAIATASDSLPEEFSGFAGYGAGNLSWDKDWADEIVAWAKQNSGHWLGVVDQAVDDDQRSYMVSRWW